MTQIKINAQEALAQMSFTVRVVGRTRARIRIAVAMALIAMAKIVLGSNITIERDEA